MNTEDAVCVAVEELDVLSVLQTDHKYAPRCEPAIPETGEQQALTNHILRPAL